MLFRSSDQISLFSRFQRKDEFMRVSVFMRSLSLLLVVASPALIRAQFQPPTDEELKMTADPKAPGAAAVYLNVEEKTTDPLHNTSYYFRIKVLTEKGKELATVEVPYEKDKTANFCYHERRCPEQTRDIIELKGRTIHPDGTIIPLTGKPEDLVTSRNDEVEKGRRVFTLPSVEVGSILEYTYTIQLDDLLSHAPFWHVQRPYFVHQARYSFTPFKAFLPQNQENAEAHHTNYLMDEHGDRINALLWWSVLPPGVQVTPDVAGVYHLEVSDIPPIPNEAWMPPVNSLLYKVLFYYKASGNREDYWVSEAKHWSKEVDQFATPSKSIQEAVASLTTPADSDLDKAKKLYKAVQALDNTDFSRTKSESELKQLHLKTAKHAEDTWAQKSGSGQDIALLYLAMLRAAGLTAYDMKVADRSQRIFDPGYLNFGQLDDDLVVVNIAGHDVLLDPGEKMCPFQTIHWKHSKATGIRQNSDTHSLVVTSDQNYNDNKLIRNGIINLDPHGAIAGQLSFTMTGQEALRWRQLALRNDLDEVKKQFDHSLESTVPDGVDAHVDHFAGLDNPDVNLVAVINVHGSFGAATAKRLLLPGFFFQTRGSHPFVNEEKRLEPVDMHYGDLVSDQVTYHLPAGFTVEGAPQDTKLSWPDHALFIEKTVPGTGQITLARAFVRSFTLAKPEEYQDLRGFYQKVAAADQAQLVLAKTAPSETGN
jgi:hypothetical protein